MSTMMDIRYALRLLAKTPVFTVLTLIVLTGGLALSIYTYSFLHSLIFRELPLAGGERMVKVYAEYEGRRNLLDAYELAQIRREVKSLTDVAAYIDRDVLVTGRDSTRSLLGTQSAWNIFGFAGVKPQLGRAFVPEDNADGAEPVAVISHKVWESMFASDPAVVGSLVTINAVSTRIVGVMPDGFAFPVASDLWIPMAQRVIDPAARGVERVSAYARIADGATVERASTEIRTVLQGQRERAQVDPKTLPDNGFATSFQSAQMGDSLPLFAALYLVAAFIFILVCTNVGNLLLSRANERARETSIRIALGAPRRRLVLQMMWESIVICVVGGVLAILVAGWALDVTNLWARTNFAEGLTFWWKWGMDSHTLVASLGFIALTILLVGALPAWRVTGGDFNAVLRDGSRGGQGRKAGRTTRWLIVVEVLLISVVLFIGSVLAVAAYRATHIDRGIDMTNLMIASVTLPKDRYTTPAARVAMFGEVQSKLAQTPGIAGAVLKSDVGQIPFAVEGAEYQLDTDYPKVYANAVGGSLEPIGMRLVQGRWFDSRDTATGMAAAIVSRSVAQRYLGGDDAALGKRVRYVNVKGEEQWRTVVGVVTDVLDGEPMARTSSTLGSYVPLSQSPADGVQVVFRHDGNADAARRAVHRAFQDVDSTVVASEILAYEEVFKKLALLAIVVTDLFVKCGLFALLLAVTGVYCLIANSVTQRMQEIGVWRALGATDGRVVRTFMWQGFRLLLVGLVLGFVVAAIASVFFSQVLAVEPVVYVLLALAVPTIITVIVLAAVYVPIRRSVQFEPIVALRYE